MRISWVWVNVVGMNEWELNGGRENVLADIKREVGKEVGRREDVVQFEGEREVERGVMKKR